MIGLGDDPGLQVSYGQFACRRRWPPTRPSGCRQGETGLKEMLDRKVRRAHLVLLIDRVWPLAWEPLSVAGTFVLVSMLGLWPLLPLQLHEGLLILFALTFLLSLVPPRALQTADAGRVPAASRNDGRPEAPSCVLVRRSSLRRTGHA